MCESGLQIAGITCAACAGILESALMRVDGVLVGTLTIGAASDTGLPVLLTTMLPAWLARLS